MALWFYKDGVHATDVAPVYISAELIPDHDTFIGFGFEGLQDTVKEQVIGLTDNPEPFPEGLEDLSTNRVAVAR